MSADALRTAPHDLDAERAVLSAILLERTALDRVLEILAPDTFYAEAHRRMFEGALALHKKGVEVDVVTLAGELRDRDRLLQVGGAAYLAEIIDCVPSVARIELYAQRIYDKWRLRQIIACCQRTAAEGYGDTGDVGSFADKAEQALYQASHGKDLTEEKTLGACARLAYTTLTKASERGDGIVGAKTGYRELDKMLGGLREGKLTIVAACPGVGKSIFVQNVAMGVASFAEGAAVQVFTPEMTEEELGERGLACAADMNAVRFRRPPIAPDDWNKIHGAMGELDKLPIWVTDNPEVTTTMMRARVRRRQREWNRPPKEGGKDGRKVALVVLDYLQLLNTERAKGVSREEALTQACRDLKVMAKVLHLHVIAVSSLNRDIKTRQDKRPIISDLRESGAIEYHADNIILMYRESFYTPDCARPNVVEVNVAKQRGGPTGVHYFALDLGKSRLREMDEDEAKDKAPAKAAVPRGMREMRPVGHWQDDF